MTDSHFQPTHWTLVLRAHGADPEAKTALSDLCAAYYSPVVAFLKKDGRGEDLAREKAHAFFAEILAKGIGQADRSRGRFRSYLLGALKHFLSRQRDAQATQKRGTNAEHLSLTEISSEPPPNLDDTLVFDREWAFTLIGRALDTLERENAKKADLFQALKPTLGVGVSPPQKELAARLGLSESALRVTIHRLRTRFRELIRAEVATTVDQPEDIAGELSHLIKIVSQN